MPADRTEKQKSRTIETRSKTMNKDKKVKKKSQSPPAPPAPPVAPSRPTSTPTPPTVTPIAPPPLIPPPTPSHSCPVEVIENILKYASQSTLGKCMQVSKVFYQVAAPLLYRNIIIKNAQPVSGVLSGVTLVDREPTRYASKVANLKAPLLSMVQQITLNAHSCKQSSFTSDTCPNLKTLLIVPEISHTSGAQWCRGRAYCPILQRARPEKVVICSNQMRTPEWQRDRSIFYHRLALSCPIVTVIFNESDLDTKFPINARFRRPRYDDVEWRYAKEIRLILLERPTRVDNSAGRKLSLWEIQQQFRQLAHSILLPLFELAVVPVTAYLFRPFGPDTGRLDLLHDILDTALVEQNQANVDLGLSSGGQKGDKRKTLFHTLKTLNEYIEEGWEDELLAEELQYWRKENQRRNDLIKKAAGKTE